MLILGITIVAMIVILFTASQIVLRYRHTVKVAEDAEVHAYLDRTVNALDEALDDLSRTLVEWSLQDETRRFMEERNQEYIDTYINTSTMEELGLNLIAFLDPDENPICAQGLDLIGDNETGIPDELLLALPEITAALSSAAQPDGDEAGVYLYRGLPLLIGSVAVRTPSHRAVSLGTLVMARKLDESEVDALAEAVGAPLSIHPANDSNAPADVHIAWGAWSAGRQYFVQRLSDTEMTGYTVVPDIFSEPILMLRVEVPRTAYLQAKSGTARLTWMVLVVGFVLGTVTLVFLERLVLSPLSHLIRTVSEIGKNSDLSARIYLDSKDELAILGQEINRMLQSLEESEQQLIRKSNQIEMLIENQGEGVVTVDRVERFNYANPAACEIFGLESGELVGKRLQDFVQAESMEIARVARKECRKYGKRTYELEITNAKNERRTLLVTITPRRDDKGGFIGTFEVFRDITERKRTEKLEASLAVKSEFLSMVSHELRTPLVPIIGYTELLLSGTFGELPDVIVEPLETIRSRAESLKKLIDDILQLNRIEHGTLGVRLESVEIASFLEEVVRPYREIEQSKETEITVDAEDFNVRADPSRLRQVVQNLVGNSIKYSGDRVEITLKAYVKDGRGHIAVRDNGIGIREEDLPYIFERFYQIENINTRKHEGAGLGLAIAKELVERMGGRIEVDSEPGKGSVFTVTLDLAKVQADAGAVKPGEERVEAGVPERETTDQGEDRMKRVLIIDDDVFSAQLLEKILEDRYEVATASCGDDGIKAVREGDFDLVLLDWMMPGMDGLSLLISLKSDESTANIPIIFVSGKAEPDAIDKGMQAGAAGFIAKPYKKDEIVRAIDEAIENAREVEISSKPGDNDDPMIR